MGNGVGGGSAGKYSSIITKLLTSTHLQAAGTRRKLADICGGHVQISLLYIELSTLGPQGSW